VCSSDLAVFALSGAAFAQVDPNYQNNIGVYSDEGATTSCVDLPVGAHDLYLVLTKLTNNECAGWEGKISAAGVLLTGFSNRGQAIDVGSRPDEHIVGYADPLPASPGTGGGVIVVADLQIFIGDISNPGFLFVDEVYFSLQEDGLPAYLDGGSSGHSLHPSMGGVNDAIFTVNGDCGAVAIEENSFGSVKSLFR